MKALILNSGVGKRMGDITKEHPKCMTEITEIDTILSRQLKFLSDNGITEVVMTTGPFEKILIDYCYRLNLPINFKFVKNPIYDSTNYIYSMYLAKNYLDDDIVLMHGDLVFDNEVLKNVLQFNNSVMVVSSTLTLPEKDFKAVINNGQIKKVGIEFFENAMAAQPLYKFNKEDFSKWMKSIEVFCKKGITNCYAEDALNIITNDITLMPVDVKDKLCNEIDSLEDLKVVSKIIKKCNR